MIGEFNNIVISGIAAAVPERTSRNDVYKMILGERRVKKQAKLTGIEKTHVSPVQQRTSDLCLAAAKELLDDLKWDEKEIDVLIFASQTPNYKLPSTAFFIQKQLGIGTDCIVYDINMGCSAFNVGLQAVASHLVNMDEGAKGLLLTGDICTELNNVDDIEPETLKNNMLFGSAGAAIAIENHRNNNMKFLLKSKGEGFDSIIRFERRPTEMKGNVVFDFAINEVSDDIIAFRDYFKINESDIDYYVLHQAQKLIVDSVVDTCNLDNDKVLNSYFEFGNTSGASIPLTLCANRDKYVSKSIRVLMSGFGVGLSWTILYMSVDTTHILPVIYTDEHYDKDKRSQWYLWNKNILFLGLDNTVCANLLENLNHSYMNMNKALCFAKDTTKFQELTKDFVYNNECLLYNSIDDIQEALISCDDVFNGVIVPIDQFSLENIAAVINTMIQAGKFSRKNPRIILLDGKVDLTSKKETYIYNLKNLLCVDSLINMIMYDGAEIKCVKKLNRDSDWIKEYIDSGFDEAMRKPFDISSLVYYMFSDNIQFVDETIFKIDK